MSRRMRVAFFLVVFTFGAAAQLASARSSSATRVDGSAPSSLTSLEHHPDSAVVPANTLVRGGRAFAELLSVPLAGMLASVSLLALWFTASIRRRERLACAISTYRRRGPPLLLPVD